MNQLLNITSVPIQVEVKVTRAQLKLSEDSPSVKVSKDKNGFQIKADPIKVSIDSAGVPASTSGSNFDTFTREQDQSDFILSYEAVAKFAQDGSQSLGIADDDDIGGADIKAFSTKRALRTIENILDYLPKGGNDISWSDGKLSVTYAAGDSNFGWDAVNTPKYEFVPANIEFFVKEMPQLDIEYLGEPIYFPLSANPNYEPVVDVRA